jgi:hypothetical protein
MGYGTNVVRFARKFHVQTEDSGLPYAHIDTQLFSPNGELVHLLRLDYSPYLAADHLRERIAQAMKVQHRRMCRMLARGEFDAAIREALGLDDSCVPGPEVRSRSRPPRSNAPRTWRPGSSRPARRPSSAPVSSGVLSRSPSTVTDSVVSSVHVPKAPRVPEFASSLLDAGPDDAPGCGGSREQTAQRASAIAENGPSSHRWDQVLERHRQEVGGRPSEQRRACHDWDAAVSATHSRRRRSGS